MTTITDTIAATIDAGAMSSTTPDSATRRQRQSLNPNWSFKRCESGDAELDAASISTSDWEQVTLPHSVRLEPINASGGRNFQGICWYARTFNYDPQWDGRVVYLHVEGAMQVCDLWLNGRKLHTHFGGYTPFVLDITSFLNRHGNNELLLRLNNNDQPDVPPGKPQRELDFVYFGGLYRNVWIESVHPLHISDPIHADRVGSGGVLVTYPHVDVTRADVSVLTHLLNVSARSRRAIVRQELISATDDVIATGEAEVLVPSNGSASISTLLNVDHPALWYPNHPHLYILRTSVVEAESVADMIETKIGIRRIDFSKDNGLSINGGKFFSLGANRHQDHPYIGYAMSDAAHWREARKLREAGFTSIRSHYPQAPAFMDACDALGLLTIVSNPGWQFMGGDLFKERAIANARLMVRRDRNRPSVILWEAALNESDNSPVDKAFQQAVHEECPGDQCFTAGDRGGGFSSDATLSWDVDYLHNDGTKPFWIREWGDAVDNWSDQQSANRVARSWGEGPLLTQARSHLARLNDLLVSHHGTSSGPAGQRLGGACLWAGIDCQRGYHHQPFLGGAMDVWRLPKFNYYLFQSQRPPELLMPSIDSGPMVFIANYATFLSPTAITVFSNCEQVRLLQNGVEIETRRPEPGHRIAHPPFMFRVDQFGTEQSTMYMTGTADPGIVPSELRAEGLIGGKVAATHIVKPPGVATRLALRVDTAGYDLVADGSDFVRVYSTICDKHGTPCPLADDWVSFAVDGPAWVIDGPSVGANPTRAEAGIATAIVQATATAGRIRVRAMAFGLVSAEIEFNSIPA